MNTANADPNHSNNNLPSPTGNSFLSLQQHLSIYPTELQIIASKYAHSYIDSAKTIHPLDYMKNNLYFEKSSKIIKNDENKQNTDFGVLITPQLLLAPRINLQENNQQDNSNTAWLRRLSIVGKYIF